MVPVLEGGLLCVFPPTHPWGFLASCLCAAPGASLLFGSCFVFPLMQFQVNTSQELAKIYSCSALASLLSYAGVNVAWRCVLVVVLA